MFLGGGPRAPAASSYAKVRPRTVGSVRSGPPNFEPSSAWSGSSLDFALALASRSRFCPFAIHPTRNIIPLTISRHLTPLPFHRHSSIMSILQNPRTHTAAWPSSPTPTTKEGPLPPADSWGPSVPAPHPPPPPLAPPPAPAQSSAASPCTVAASSSMTDRTASCPIRPTENFYGRWRLVELLRK